MHDTFQGYVENDQLGLKIIGKRSEGHCFNSVSLISDDFLRGQFKYYLADSFFRQRGGGFNPEIRKLFLHALMPVKSGKLKFEINCELVKGRNSEC